MSVMTSQYETRGKNNAHTQKPPEHNLPPTKNSLEQAAFCFSIAGQQDHQYVFSLNIIHNALS